MNSTFKHRKLYLPKTDYSDMEDEEMYGLPYSPVDKRILAICPRIKDGFICNSPSFKHWKLIDDDRREIFHNQSNRATTEAITSIKYDPDSNNIVHLNSAIDTQNIFSSVDKTNALPSECLEPNNTKQIKPKVEETKELKKSKRGRRSQPRCRPSSKKTSHISYFNFNWNRNMFEYILCFEEYWEYEDLV